MKGITVFAAIVVGAILLMGLCVGVSYTKYDSVTTTFEIEDGITCTVNGKEVANGDTVTYTPDMGRMKICVESDYDQYIGYTGRWSSSQGSVASSFTEKSVKNTGELVVDFGHGDYTGNIKIAYIDSDDYQTLTMTFNITGDVKVVAEGVEIMNGDVKQYNTDIHITVTANDGQKHNIDWSYWWGDSSESGSGNGSEYNSSTSFTVENMAYFDPHNGSVTISM